VEPVQPKNAAHATSNTFTKRERFAHYADIVNAIIHEYVRIKNLSPIVAQTFDPHPVTTSQKLTLNVIGYKIDIENATEQALKDRLDLQAAWFGMALGERVPPELRQEVIWACGRLYAARFLQPWAYWRRSGKRGYSAK
jgi:hypothetical protein